MRRLDEREAWICLASAKGVAEHVMGDLLAEFGAASEILLCALDGRLRRWNAERPAGGAQMLPARTIDEVVAVARDPRAPLERLRALRLWTLSPLDDDYPPRLRALDPPPNVIHGWGARAALAARRSVAIVGTRRPTPAGRALAARLAHRLAAADAVVVSGLAVGIDGAAHAACVERDSATVAVIGAGHATPGPRAHAALREGMLASGGAIVGEHAPDVGATRGTYPRRNRIIAALADAVIVVEAPLRSGALITARHAFELGRPVYVAPGRVGDWSVAGSLALLHDTEARPIIGPEELVDDLGYLDPGPAASRPIGPASRDAALSSLGAAERLVAERLISAPSGLDGLVERTGLAPATVAGAVTMLLMRGWVQAVGPAYLPSGPLLG